MAAIKTEIEEVSSIKKKIKVSVPVEKVKDVLEKEFKKVTKEAKLKGFRKGKVPKHMIEKYYGETINKETMESLVRDTYPEALEKEMAAPISAPYIEPGPFEKDKPFTYEATFEVKPIVEIKGYEALKLEKPEVAVTKEEVDLHLERIRQQMAQLEPVDEKAKSETGSVMIIDFKGTSDGKPFKGSEAKDFYVELGAGNMLPDFEKALTGLKIGQEADFNFEYPKDYFNNDLAGTKGEFHVKVKDIKKKVMPELNDEFAKDLGQFETLADIKKDIEEKILQAKEQDVKRVLSTQVIEQLVEKHPLEVPEAMVNNELRGMFEGFMRQLSSQGQKLEDTGMTIESFIEQYKPDAESRVKSFLIIDAIAEVEKIGATDEDVEGKLNIISQQVNQPVPKVRQQYESQNLIGGLKVQIKHEKTLDLIIDKAKIKVKKEKKASKKAK